MYITGLIIIGIAPVNYSRPGLKSPPVASIAARVVVRPTNYVVCLARSATVRCSFT